MQTEVKYSLASGGITVIVGLAVILLLLNLGALFSVVLEVLKWIVISASVIGLAVFGYAYFKD